jgi:hypothetical protein
MAYSVSYHFRFGTPDALGHTEIPYDEAELIELPERDDGSVLIRVRGNAPASLGGYHEVSCLQSNSASAYILNMNNLRIPMGSQCFLMKDTVPNTYTVWVCSHIM